MVYRTSGPARLLRRQCGEGNSLSHLFQFSSRQQRFAVPYSGFDQSAYFVPWGMHLHRYIFRATCRLELYFCIGELFGSFPESFHRSYKTFFSPLMRVEERAALSFKLWLTEEERGQLLQLGCICVGLH